MARTRALVPGERIENAILLLRGEKVLLDEDLAELYEVETRALIQAVKRSRERFPRDFHFQLTAKEAARLRSQIVISNGRGGRRHRPYVFTEQGVAMISGVLKSERAVRVNVEIMRAFVRLRRLLVGHAELERKLAELEQRYDSQFAAVFEAIRQLMKPPARSTKTIGFGG